MSFQRTVSLSLVLAAALAVSVPARAAPPAPAGVRVCGADSAGQDRPLRGICITGRPQGIAGRLQLGRRTLRPGDFLTAAQMEQVSFRASGSGRSALVRCLPVFSDGPAPETWAVCFLRNRETQPPSAEDFEVETYQNLPAEGLLRVEDPLAQPLTFAVVRPPRLGEVILRPDGSYLYIPARNRMGTDSFVFTAAAPDGRTSRQATVTVRILRSTASRPYSDTAGTGCRFSAEWLREAGIFSGETIGGESCFFPEKPVTRGQFLVMLMQTLRLPADRSADASGNPSWLQPYLRSACRSGLLAPSDAEFRPGQPLRAAEAAVLAERAAAIALPGGIFFRKTAAVPASGPVCRTRFPTDGSRILTRADAARILWQLRRLNDTKVLISSPFGQ